MGRDGRSRPGVAGLSRPAVFACLPVVAVLASCSLGSTGGALVDGRGVSNAWVAAKAAAAKLTVARAVGQLLIVTYPGVHPPASLLSAVRAGQVGGIILMGPNTAGGNGAVRAATAELQRAARGGGHPGLLIMTDQEGGEVKRLAGPPAYAASQMSNPTRALKQGTATGRLLRSVGVNLDLAPVADVARVRGPIATERRAFGSSPGVVARAACAFARGLASQDVGYTLKHFPGLGDTYGNTDERPVSIDESAAQLAADGAAYRRCGRARLAAVMVSSASYTNLTGRTPAVMSPTIYRTVLPRDGVSALPISDSFDSGSIAPLRSPARRSIAAGVDMVMYPNSFSAGLDAYRILLADVRGGSLSEATVRAAAARVLELKATLGAS